MSLASSSLEIGTISPLYCSCLIFSIILRKLSSARDSIGLKCLMRLTSVNIKSYLKSMINSLGSTLVDLKSARLSLKSSFLRNLIQPQSKKN